jgi:hypothetical protein
MYRGNVDVLKEGKPCKIRVLRRTRPGDGKRLLIVIDDASVRSTDSRALRRCYRLGLTALEGLRGGVKRELVEVCEGRLSRDVVCWFCPDIS